MIEAKAGTVWWWWPVVILTVGGGLVRIILRPQSLRWNSTSPLISSHPRAFFVAAAIVIVVAIAWLVVQATS